MLLFTAISSLKRRDNKKIGLYQQIRGRLGLKSWITYWCCCHSKYSPIFILNQTLKYCVSISFLTGLSLSTKIQIYEQRGEGISLFNTEVVMFCEPHFRERGCSLSRWQAVFLVFLNSFQFVLDSSHRLAFNANMLTRSGRYKTFNSSLIGPLKGFYI